MSFLDITAILDWMLPIIVAYGPLSVFVLILAEEIIVPIPSPLFPMAAGFILVPATASLSEALPIIIFSIVIPGAIATALGSLVIFAVGYYGGAAVVNKFKRFFGTSVSEIEKAGNRLEKGKSTWATIAGLRAIPIFPTSIVSLASGVLRLDVKRYFVATLVGAVPRIFILSVIGWQLGSAFITIAESFSSVENVLFFVILALAVVAFVYYFRFSKKRKVG